MFETFRNAWKVEELRKRILYTLLILVIFRLGCAVPVPYVDASVLDAWFGTGNMLDYLNMMSGSALSQCTLFALGVSPYINSSIIIQLLTVAIPALERLSKEGEEGRRKLTRITKYVSGGIALGMSIGYYFVLRNLGALSVTGWQAWFVAVVIILCFTAGAQLTTFLGEQVDSKGIGNGVSLLIFTGIIANWSNVVTAVNSILTKAATQPLYYLAFPGVIILALAAVVFVVILTNAERRLPVQYAKRVVGRKMYGGQSSHIPIKVNMSGVMPVIFASALCSIPGTIGGFINLDAAAHPYWTAFFNFFSARGWGYMVFYLLLIIGFNYFYVAIQYNPVEIANNLRQNNGAIPGYRPGKPTSDFITKVLGKITLVGALFLGVVAVLPILLGNVTGLPIQLGGTSLLIVVGVALDTSRSMESFMVMRHHKGFLQ